VTQQETIKGKVARVLNSRELAINCGEEHGVQVGMIFAVLDPKGEDITDPDSEEVIGSIGRTKVLVEVVKVEQRLSLARTFRKREVNVGGGGAGLSQLSMAFLPPKWVTRYETFRSDEAAWEDLPEEKSIVKRGDPVEQVPKKVLETEEDLDAEEDA